MNGTFRKRGGRPRLAGAREASGRLSRRISDREKEFRAAQAYWRDFGLGVSHGHFAWNADAAHPVLRLVNLGKIDANSFIILLYWMCTDAAIARDCFPRTIPHGCHDLAPGPASPLGSVVQSPPKAARVRRHPTACWCLAARQLARESGEMLCVISDADLRRDLVAVRASQHGERGRSS
jgi:hypothetical protein